MGWVLSIVGLLVGTWLVGAVGALVGVALGIAAAQIIGLRGKVAALRASQSDLEQRLLDLEQGNVASAGRDAQAQPSKPARVETAPPVAQKIATVAETVSPPSPPSAPQEMLTPAAPPPSRQWALQAIQSFFRDGNTFVRVGVVLLLFGAAFLVKYAADRDLISIETRLAGAALFAMGLVGLGFRLRNKRKSYALILQGGGVGILYIVVFAAYRLYELLPSPLTFALLVAICAFTTFVAIVEDAAALAFFAAAGGFAAPVLASSGAGNHVVLFSYHAILNAGVFAISWFKPWRALNLLGFFFTFAVGTAWGLGRYTDTTYPETQFFLTLFFAFYLGTSVLFAWRKRGQAGGWVDGTLVFGTPIVCGTLQFALVADFPFGVALSAIVMATVYLLLGTWLFRRVPAQLRLMVESFLALGVAFATLAIPFALDAELVAVTWALEGAGVAWLGRRQQRWLPRAAGFALQGAALIAFLTADLFSGQGVPFANAYFLGSLVLGAGAIIAAYNVRGSGEGVRAGFSRLASLLLLFNGSFWWIAGAFSEFEARSSELGMSSGVAFHCALLWCAFSAVAAEVIGRKVDFRALRQVALFLGPALFPLVAISIDNAHHPAGALGFVAWPLTLLFWIAILRWRDMSALRSRLNGFAHFLNFPLIGTLVAAEVAWVVSEWFGGGTGFETGSLLLAWCAVAAAAVAIHEGHKRDWWPFSRHREAYFFYGVGALFLVLFIGGLGADFDAGSASPLPYIPLANPLDISRVCAVLMLLSTGLVLRANMRALSPDESRVALATAGLFSLETLTAIIARTIHHLLDVPFRGEALWRSAAMQTSVSIAWAASGLILMGFGVRKARRGLWIAGAVPTAAVVVKLFLVDLARVGTLARIISFVVVGSLLLLIGFFAPVPPARRNISPRIAPEEPNAPD